MNIRLKTIYFQNWKIKTSKLLRKNTVKNEVITSKYWFSYQVRIPIICRKWNHVKRNLNFLKRKKTKSDVDIKSKAKRRKWMERGRRREGRRDKNGNVQRCHAASSCWKDSMLVQSTGLVKGETKSGYNENNTKQALMNLHLVKNEWFAMICKSQLGNNVHSYKMKWTSNSFITSSGTNDARKCDSVL